MMIDHPSDIIPQPSLEQLNSRQVVDYAAELADLLDWLEHRGKDPEYEEGLAKLTARNYMNRIDKFHRWVWNNEGNYTRQPNHQDADNYVDQLKRNEITTAGGEPYSNETKRKDVNALQKLFQWRAEAYDEEEWTTETSFSTTSHNHVDTLSIEERTRLREAVLDFETIPAYNDLCPEERDRWKGYLAQKLGKPKSKVSPEDWNKENQSWKLTSLLWTSLDAGLRPIEVGRATTAWVRLDKSTLFIPRDDSSKNFENWEVSLQHRTADALERWLEQRENGPKYDGTNRLWLNRQGNPYNAANLNYLMKRLCQHIDLDQENRRLTWYSIRHSVGTYMASKGNLAEVKEQLRHKSLDSTMRYAHPTIEDRRETLGKIG